MVRREVGGKRRVVERWRERIVIVMRRDDGWGGMKGIKER